MVEQILPESGRVVTREDAKAFGLKRFFSGVPCARGHVAERHLSSRACVECALENGRRYYADDPEKERAESRRYRIEHPDKVREAYRKWADANPDKVKANGAKWNRENADRRRALDRLWKAENHELLRARAKIWYAANIDKYRAWQRGWCAANPEKCRQYNRNYRKFHPEACRAQTAAYHARKKSAPGRWNAGDVAKLLTKQRQRCAYCHACLKRKFEVDHIMPLVLGGSNWPSNLQLLCKPCNASKSGMHPIDFAQKKGFLL